jgi:hypothetical protein
VLPLHARDDAFVYRQPGVALGEYALAALVAVFVGGWRSCGGRRGDLASGPASRRRSV